MHAHLFVGSSKIEYEQARNGALATRTLTEVVRVTETSEDAVRHLVSLGLFRAAGDDFHVFPGTRQGMGDVRIDERFERVTIYQGIDAFEFTDFGLEFCRAVVAPI